MFSKKAKCHFFFFLTLTHCKPPSGSPQRHPTLVAAGHSSFVFFFLSFHLSRRDPEHRVQPGGGRGAGGAYCCFCPRSEWAEPRKPAWRGDPVQPQPPRERDPPKSAECGRGKFSNDWDPRPHPTPHTAEFQHLNVLEQIG